MENSMGFMAVFAVSGSVVLLARQIHKHLLSDFMKKMEIELGRAHEYRVKKKVRFADDVIEPSSNNEEYRKRRCGKQSTTAAVVVVKEEERKNDAKLKMPANRLIMYKEIIEFNKNNRQISL